MRRLLPVLVLTGALLVLLAGPAMAHASFDVRQVPARSTQDVVLRVPLERDAVNDLVEVLVPGAFTVTACAAAEGWTCAQEATADGDLVVTLTRTGSGAGDAERFTLTLTAPAEEGVYAFPTIQTYDDGEEAAWINEPGTDRPAPRIQVGDATTPVESTGDATPHTDLADDPSEEPAPTPDPSSDATPSPTPSPIEVPDSDASDGADSADAPDDAVAADAADAAVDEDGSDSTLLLVVAAAVVLVGGAAVALRRR